MAGFVNGQIGEVQEEKAGAIESRIKEEQCVERESDDGAGTRDGFPIVEQDGSPSIGRKINQCD
jgi:hypothetical protein